jgi:hypothetical protein
MAFKEPHTEKPRSLSAADIQQLIDGKDYVVVYGVISYSDVFGKSHFQQICLWSYLAPKPVVIDSSACTNFNRIDENY